MNELFGTERVPIGFERVTLRQTKDGEKVARMRFAIMLESKTALLCPPEIRAAYEAVETRENKITAVELGLELPGVNLEFYALPDSKALSAAMQSVNLVKLEVERDEAKGKSTPHLLFTIEVPIKDKTKLRYWLVDNVFGQLWASFEIAQMTLTPGMTQAAAGFEDGASKKVQ